MGENEMKINLYISVTVYKLDAGRQVMFNTNRNVCLRLYTNWMLGTDSVITC